MDHSRALPHLGGDELLSLVPYTDSVALMEEAFLALSDYSQLPRTHVGLDGAELLMMPAFGPGGLGVKLLTLTPDNPALGVPLINGAYMLFSPGTLVAESTIDGAALTALRTATVSALATKHLASPEASRLVVFGAGAQASAHIAAMVAIRPIEHVTIVGTTSPRAHELRTLVQESGLACELGEPDAVSGADIVCACTTSTEVLFKAELVTPDTHINAVGVYRPDVRELDGAVLGAAEVVVETRAAALAEGGDVILAIEEGWLEPTDLIELGDLISGDAVRRTDKTSTVFKSVGLALEDLALARGAASRWAAAEVPGAR